MKRIFHLFVVLACLFSIGCAPKMYYYGSYSHTLYRYKKTPNEENLEKHKTGLLNIFEESNKKKLRVPPGLYCEYGYLLAKEGKKEDALKYLQLEEDTYPESKQFTQRLKTTLLDGSGNAESYSKENIKTEEKEETSQEKNEAETNESQQK